MKIGLYCSWYPDPESDSENEGDRGDDDYKDADSDKDGDGTHLLSALWDRESMVAVWLELGHDVVTLPPDPDASQEEEKYHFTEVHAHALIKEAVDRINARKNTKKGYQGILVEWSGHGVEGAFLGTDWAQIPFRVFELSLREELTKIGVPVDFPIINIMDCCQGAADVDDHAVRIKMNRGKSAKNKYFHDKASLKKMLENPSVKSKKGITNEEQRKVLHTKLVKKFGIDSIGWASCIQRWPVNRYGESIVSCLALDSLSVLLDQCIKFKLDNVMFNQLRKCVNYDVMTKQGGVYNVHQTGGDLFNLTMKLGNGKKKGMYHRNVQIKSGLEAD